MAGVEHSARKHALLSASGSTRWLNCSPSARLEEKFPNKSSVYAEEGTLAHENSDVELLYRLGEITKRVYNSELKKIQKNKLYSSEMPGEVDKYVTFVMETFNSVRRDHPDAVIMVEQRLDFSHIVKGGFGTGDVLIIADGVMWVIDLKYGKGVAVSAEDNPQLKLYGVGALRAHELSYDIQTVRLCIMQPRLDSLSTFDISVDDLNDWAENTVKPGAEKAYTGEGEYKTGSWCKFCKAKSVCRAMAEDNLKLAKFEFADPDILADFEIAEVLGKLDVLTDWAKSVKDYALEEALKGKEWPGFKVVEGRSIRKWLDEKKVTERLVKLDFKPDQFEISKLAGIGVVEKLLGKKDFYKELNELVVKPQGAPTLAPESDKRPGMGLAKAKQEFKDD